MRMEEITMATIKSYTDIEQSKKLAEILPIESADMAWCNNSIKGVNYTDEYSVNLYTVKEMQECFDEALNGWDKYWKLIPCWSLAALLDLYPMALVMDFSGKYAAVCISSPMSFADNPIDAVYEIIIWLNENNNKP